MKKTVSILLFDDIEVLDFAGPLDVFLLANEHGNRALFDVRTVAKSKAAISAAYSGLSINPDFDIKDVGHTDILIVPGGNDISHVLEDQELLAWISTVSASAFRVLSVCSGSLILAKAGLLKGLKAATHHADIDELEQLAPETEIVNGVRFVDNGQLVTSAGITSGIDMSLHVIGSICGNDIANRTAKSLEYTPRF